MTWLMLVALTLRPAPPAAARTFTTPAGLVFNQVVPEKAADFEAVVKRALVGLRASRDAVRRQQADGWRVYKAGEPYQGKSLYVFVLDPAVPGADYSMLNILTETAPTDVQELATRFTAACTAQTFWNLTPSELQVDARVEALHGRVQR
jgi:hypothetical protein